jgi:hypothetical protein
MLVFSFNSAKLFLTEAKFSMIERHSYQGASLDGQGIFSDNFLYKN